MNEPTDAMYVELECPSCSGRGCDLCDDGHWRLTECPQRFIGDVVLRACRFAGIARRGTWPVAGGSLDQTRWFIEFCDTFWNEQDVWKAKLGLPDG